MNPTPRNRSVEPSTSSISAIVARLVDEAQDGDRLDWNAIEQRFPEHVQELRLLWPTIAALIEAGPTSVNSASGSEALHGERKLAGTLGDYELAYEIGRGGMGIVYQARQISLQREVALKTLPLAGHLDERQLKRFKNEATAAASIHHPNIVPVYAIGQDRGVHFFAMKLIRGCDLTRIITDLRRAQGLPAHWLENVREQASRSTADPDSIAQQSVGSDNSPSNRVALIDTVQDVRCGDATDQSQPSYNSNDYFRWIARIGLQAAQGLQHAHDEGIIHRDIKPANLIIEFPDHLWITDFGLALFPTNESLSVTGNLLGTVRYMSPEQARGSKLDTRTDVYSLAATLYELLTLRPAFTQRDRTELLNAILTNDVPLATVNNPAIPEPLALVVHKAMQRDAEDRYASAGDLAADLERFLGSQPVIARRATWFDRAARWQRRNPRKVVATTFGLLAASVVLFVLVISIGRVYRAESVARREADKARIDADEALALAETRRMAAERSVYNLQLRRVESQWREDPQGALAILDNASLCPPELRDFTWGYYHRLASLDHRQLVGHTAGVSSVAFSPDDRRLVTGGKDNTVRLWDLASGRQVAVLSGHLDWVTSVAYAPNGESIASASRDRSVRLWSVETGTHLRSFVGHTHTVQSVAFSPDGATIATASHDGTVKLWDVNSGQQLHSTTDSQLNQLCVAFSPDGQWVASGGADLCVTMRRSDTWNVAAMSDQPKPIAEWHKSCDWTTAIAFSKDQQTIVSCNLERSLTAYDAHTLRGIPAWQDPDTPRHNVAIRAVSVSSDGTRIVSAGDDGTLKVWQSDTGKEELSLETRGGGCRDVAYSHVGHQIAAASDDGTVELWHVYNDEADILRSGWAFDLAISAAARKLYSAHADGTVSIHDIDRPDSTTRIAVGGRDVYAVAVSPNGDLWASGGDDRFVKLWDTTTNAAVATLTGHDHLVRDLVFSPDGKRLVAGDRSGTIRVWDVVSRREVAILHGHADRVWSLAISHDGRWLASASRDRSLRVWDLLALRQHAVRHHEYAMSGLRFSPDGGTLVNSTVRTNPGGEFRGLIELRNTSDWKVRTTLSGHKDEILATAISPDGRTLASGSSDRVVRLWDFLTGEERATLRGHGDWIYALQFAPDGNCLTSASRDGSTRLWRAMPMNSHVDKWKHTNIAGPRRNNFEDLQQPSDVAIVPHRALRSHRGAIHELVFSPNGTQLASASFDQSIRLWDTDSWCETSILLHDSAVVAAMYSPDGAQLVADEVRQQLTIWELGSESVSPVLTIPNTNSHIWYRGRLISCYMSEDAESLELRELITGTDVQLSSADETTSFAELTMPNQLSRFGNHVFGAENNRLVRWRLSTSGAKGEVGISHAPVISTRVSADGTTFAVASRDIDAPIVLWDASTFTPRVRCLGHLGIVWSLAISPDSRLVASGGDDHTVRLWDITDGHLLLTFGSHTSSVNALVFSPDGRWLVSGESDRVIHVWDMETLRGEMSDRH